MSELLLVVLSSFTIFGSVLVSAVETDDAPTDEAEPPPQETVAGVRNPLSEAVRKPEDYASDADAEAASDAEHASTETSDSTDTSDTSDTTSTSEDDAIDAGAGDDIVDGRAGDDRLAGGKGADSISGSAGNDILYGADADGPDDGAVDTQSTASDGVTLALTDGSEIEFEGLT